jgi:thiol-disulfide isomerase/thioredoxin
MSLAHVTMRGRFTRRRWLAAGAALVIIGGLTITLLLAAFDRFTIEGLTRPVLRMHTADGRSLQLITPYGRRHLLLFFLVSCPHCHAMLEHLGRLRSAAAGCDVFAVSLSGPDATTAFTAGRDDPFPIWLMTPREALVELGIRRVPTLLFVGESDRVDRIRVGGRSFEEDSVMVVRYCNGGS